MKIRNLVFLCGCFLFLATMLPLAFWLGGSHCAINLVIASTLCTIPAFLTFMSTEFSASSSPERRAAVFFIGMAVRMIVVLGGSAILVTVFPQLVERGDLMFWGW